MTEHFSAHRATTSQDHNDDDRAEHLVFPVASLAYEREQAERSLSHQTQPHVAQDSQRDVQRSSSDRTLQGQQQPDEKKEDKEDDSDGQKQEEEGQEAPPPPVGFFDPRLHKTRITVAKKYCLTSKEELEE